MLTDRALAARRRHLDLLPRSGGLYHDAPAHGDGRHLWQRPACPAASDWHIDDQYDERLHCDAGRDGLKCGSLLKHGVLFWGILLVMNNMFLVVLKLELILVVRIGSGKAIF